METIASFPFLPLDFTAEGLPDAGEYAAFLDALSSELADVTDLFVLSHGWNNNTADARTLYTTLLGNMRATLDAGYPAGAERHYAVLGIFWPSMKFVDDDLRPEATPDGGAMSAEAPSLPSSLLTAKIERLGALLGAGGEPALERARRAAQRLEQQAAAKADFVEALRDLLDPPADSADDNSRRLFEDDPDDLFEALDEPVDPRGPGGDEADGAADLGVESVAPGDPDPDGTVQSFGSMLAGVKAAAWRLLNYTTYYVMKERAGMVGSRLNAILAEARQRRPELRLHLVGHSFGARVVTAAVAGDTPFGPSSLSLLQGAFSHNGFSPDVDRQPGFFRSVIAERRVAGPIIATHTKNDRAVGIAYAIASRLSNDRTTGLGDANDVFGGIGRNGAVRMGPGETVAATLEASDFRYAPFAASLVQNLLADRYIASHGDVTSAAVANAVLSAAVGS